MARVTIGLKTTKDDTGSHLAPAQFYAPLIRSRGIGMEMCSQAIQQHSAGYRQKNPLKTIHWMYSNEGIYKMECASTRISAICY